MTANVSIVVAQKEQVLKVPNAASRFSPPKGDRAESGLAEGKAAKAEGRPAASRPAHSSAESGPPTRKVWKQDESGELVSVSVQTGISDGVATEIVGGSLGEQDTVIVGLDVPRANRQGSELPPGFGGGGGQRRTRDRGI
jgi:HlyD family secretion protein